MFPYDAWFSLKNEPRFDLPGDEQQAFGEKVESKLRATEFYFEETSIDPGRVANGVRYFAFRIHQDRTRLNHCNRINGEYYIDEKKVRFHSELAPYIVVPVIRVLLSDYMKVATDETIIDPADTNTSENMTKSVPLLEKLHKLVLDNEKNPPEHPNLFSGIEFRVTMHELFRHGWDTEYEVPRKMASYVTDLWMETRQALIRYISKLEPTPELTNALDDLKHRDLYFFFERREARNVNRFPLNSHMIKGMWWATHLEDGQWRADIQAEVTPDTTYSWMKRTWNDEVEPTFAELMKILKGETNLSSTEIADKITSNRPNGETKYNPILKYLKSKSALEIQEALAELPAKKAKELEEILDKYHQSWSALLSLFSEVFKENGIGYSLRNAYLENKRTWEQINDEYRGVEKEESKNKNTKAFEKVKSTLNTIAEHEDSGSIVANYYKTHSQKSQAKGVCEFSGDEVHPQIDITPGKSIKVKKTLYSFTAAGEWKTINKFLRSIKSGDDHSSTHYPVPLTTKEVSALKGDAKALFKDYIERQPTATKDKNKKYEPYARFKLELLK